MDELAEYMEEILEYSMVLRLQVPKQMQAAADQDMSTYTALLVVFTALCAFVYVYLTQRRLFLQLVPRAWYRHIGSFQHCVAFPCVAQVLPSLHQQLEHGR